MGAYFRDLYQDYCRRRREDGLSRSIRAFGPVRAGRSQAGARELLNFSSNDYLGLATHPELAARAALWAQRWGAGAGASRLVTGTFDAHLAVERKLANLKQTEAALVFPAGFQANVSVLAALLDRRILGLEPLVFADRLNHASLHLGCQAAGARQRRYRHNDLAHLESLLAAADHEKRPKFILTESVFSMDGDRADIARLAALAARHNALLYVDEAHATGVLGPGGGGLTAGISGDHLLAMGTFSKALGGMGAYVAGPQDLIDFLVQTAAGFVYSTAVAPPVLGMMDAALDLMPAMERARAELARSADRLRAAFQAAGFGTGASDTQIVPLILGPSARAQAFARALEEAGILGVAIRPPTVPQGQARVRFAVTAAHGEADLDRLITCIARLGRNRVAAE